MALMATKTKERESVSTKSIINTLAEFMQWKMEARDFWWYKDGQRVMRTTWSPPNNWNDWRMVEEKIMEDEVLHRDFLMKFWNEEEAWGRKYMKSDLLERCKVLIYILSK